MTKRTVKKSGRPGARSTATSPWVPLPRNGAGLHPQDFLTFRLTRLSNALRTNITKRYLEEFGLSLPEWRLLALVTRFSPVRFSELTSRSSMDKGQVSRTLRVTSKRGLTKTKVVRGGSVSADALAAPVVVTVTAKGKALYKAVLPAAQRRQAELLATLSEGERSALYSVLEKLFAAVGSTATEDDDAA